VALKAFFKSFHMAFFDFKNSFRIARYWEKKRVKFTKKSVFCIFLGQNFIFQKNFFVALKSFFESFNMMCHTLKTSYCIERY